MKYQECQEVNQWASQKLNKRPGEGILEIGIYSGRTLAWKAKILNSTAAPIWFWIRDKYVQQSSKAKVYMILLISILLDLSSLSPL